MSRTLLILIATAMLLPALAGGDELFELYFDDANVSTCNETFQEAGLTSWLAETTDDDCSGSGFCDFGWTEGVIYMHPVRLVVDISAVGVVDSVQFYGWVIEPDNLRLFLYQGDTIVEQVSNDWYGGQMTIYGNGQSYDRLVVSACDGELYEMFLYASEPVDVDPSAPASIARLKPAYPNPFNPKTTLSYSLPAECVVKLTIHDIAGRKLRSLVDGQVREEGDHLETWDGRDTKGELMASGAYIARLETPYGNECRRLLLVK
ncbi:hypothetical protein H8E52_10795 [bacterium]|nr:hypothetical protein [bacterium]